VSRYSQVSVSLARLPACMHACTHARTRAHTHALSLSRSPALSGCEPTPREVDCTVLGGREEHQSGLFLHTGRGRRGLGCKGPRVWYERERERERERETLCVCPPVSLPACVQMSDVRNMYVIHICYICVHHECLLHSKKIRPFPLLRPAHNTHTIQGARHSTSRMLLAVTAPLSNPRPRQSRAQARPKNTRPSPWLCSLPLPPSLQCWYLCKCVF
jgi:hypothetical protein